MPVGSSHDASMNFENSRIAMNCEIRESPLAKMLVSYVGIEKKIGDLLYTLRLLYG